MIMIMLILLLPFGLAMAATWGMVKGPIAFRERASLGLICFLAALAFQYWIGPLIRELDTLTGWLSGVPSLHELLLDAFFGLGLRITSPAVEEFLQAARLLPWAVNIAAIVAVGVIWQVACRGLPASGQTTPALLGKWLFGRPLRYFHVTVAAGIGLLAFFCLYVRPWLMVYGLDPFNLSTAHLDGVFWFGPWALVALMAGAIAPVEPAEPALDQPERAALAGATADIEGLLDHVSRNYGEARAWQGKIPIKEDRIWVDPQKSGDTMSDRIYRRLAAQITIAERDRPRLEMYFDQAFADFWNDRRQEVGEKTWEPWNVLIDEELAHAHLIVLAEVIQSCHDHGGAVLVLAPPWTLDRVRRALAAAGEKAWTDITQRWCYLAEDTFDPTKQYNVVFASVQALETELLSRYQHDAGVRRLLDMLRMVVVFDFHLLEAAILRLRLRRMRSLTRGQRVRVICQTESRDRIHAVVENAFRPISEAGFRDIRIAATQPGVRNLVLWRNEGETLKTLYEQEVGGTAAKPIEIAPLLARMARGFHLSPAFIDADGRWDRAVWNTLVPGLVGDGVSNFPPPQARCIIVEDRANLVDSVLQHRNYHGVDAYVLAVVSHRYALRDWLLSKIQTAGNDDLDHLRPIAPDPQGGLIEVSMILAAEFQQTTQRVPQTRIVELFRELEVRTADAFGLFPTGEGIRRVFALVNGPRDVLDVETEQDRYHGISFRLPVGSRPPRPPLLNIPVNRGLHLSPSDHGLRYAQDTTLHDAGRVYKIDSVDLATRGQERITAASGQGSGFSRLSYLFHRQYALSFAPDRLAIEAGGDLQQVSAGVYYRRAALRGEFERLTGAIGVLDEASSAPVHETLWGTRDIRVLVRHAAVLLWRLEISSGEAPNWLDGENPAATAFTLAATLQDVLGSLFPMHAHRLAVLSPQAAPCLADLVVDMHASNQERFPADLYPRLIDKVPFRLPPDPRLQPPATVEAIETALTDLLTRSGREAVHGEHRTLDLIIVEDADHDLGVVRALEDFAVWQRVHNVWAEFTYWLADEAEQGRNTSYYRFGGEKLSSCFAFAEAARVVERTARGRAASRAT